MDKRGIWKKGKTKKEYPNFSNTGMKKGQTNGGSFGKGIDIRRINTQFKPGKLHPNYHKPTWNKGINMWIGKEHPSLGRKRPDTIKRNLENNPMNDLSIVRKSVIKRLKTLKFKPTKPEKVLINIFNKLSLPYKYVGDGEVMIGRFNPDFINCNGQKKIIEMFGDYWHRNDNPQDRIDYFTKYGFNTLIIWERELKNIDNVIMKIKEFENE